VGMRVCALLFGPPALQRESGRYDYPVTGGTGRYRNARGWVKIRDIGATGKTADSFHLLL